MDPCSPKKTLTRTILDHALKLGFCAADCSPVHGKKLPDRQLQSMITQQRHATMHYLETSQQARNNPEQLLPGIQTIVSVALSYNHPQQHRARTSFISRYATIPDYHRVMRHLLQQLLDVITENSPDPVNGLICVDSTPVYEKTWAEHAGIGVTGNNTLCIIPGHGSYCFLGEILLDIPLDCTTDRTPADPCGECRRCIDACPTGALIAPGTLDARRCISYLTIEHKDDFTPEEEESIGTHLFGCDICQDICPHNHTARPAAHNHLPQNDNLLNLTPEHILQLTRSRFKTLFAGTPIYRTGLKRLKRNAQAVMNNRKIGDVLS
ncbi:tRNA epoxyqueuosine(34) reductase QueG [Prosthecochloris sp. HL-130-GSB]|nr:tRNA epoxyqueuosine(34) reductase QueG [Prosthecochloris sp. HL-130-GSB]